jgi:putative transcriptional regulator
MKAIKPGTLLVAEPFAVDPYFKRSVVLLCEHDDEGTVGFILNKALELDINELVSDFPEFDVNLNFGGPVQNDTLHYIHNVGDLLDGSKKIINNIYWGGDYEKLKFLIASELIKPHNIRFFIGYSGWTPGQLQQELKLGSWVLHYSDPNYLFNQRPEYLWSKVLSDKGNTFRVISEIPEQMSWN